MLLLDPREIDKRPLAPKPDLAEAHARLLERLEILSERDRIIVELALKHGLSRRQIGAAVDLSPGNVTRRIRAILARLNDPIVTALANPISTLSPEMRQLGLEYFAQRMTIGALMERHGLSRRAVNQQLNFIRGWQRGVSTRRDSSMR